MSVRKISKRLGIVLGVVVVASVLGVLGLATARNQSPLPKEFIMNAQFKIYYPSKLPDDYELATSKTKLADGVLFYSLRKPTTPPTEITISAQQAPPNFNPELQFGELDIPSSLSRIGKVYDLGKDAPGVRYMIYQTNGSLLFISSEQEVDASTVFTLIDTLEPID